MVDAGIMYLQLRTQNEKNIYRSYLQKNQLFIKKEIQIVTIYDTNFSLEITNHLNIFFIK